MIWRQVGVLAAAALLLGACENGWYGDPEAPPLPGDRRDVLPPAATLLEADPALRETPPELPNTWVNQQWSQSGGDSGHALGHLALPASIEQVWRSAVGTGASRSQRLLAQPVVAEGTTFAIDAEGRLAAFDLISGRQFWRVSLVPDDEREIGLGGGVAYAGGKLYATAGFAEVLVIDPVDGALLWKQRLPAPARAAPTVSGRRIYAATMDNRLTAIDADDGELLWSHDGLVEEVGLIGAASPAVSAGLVIVPYSSGEVYALQRRTGAVRWADNLIAVRRLNSAAALADIRAMPVIAGGRVFAVSQAGRMLALELRLGRRLWDLPIGSVSQPAVAGDVVFVLDVEQRLFALNARDGAVYWVTALDRYEDDNDEVVTVFWTGPTLAGDHLYVVSSDKRMLAIDARTGGVMRTFNLPGPSSLPPVVAEQTLLVLTNDADLVAFREP